MESIITSAVIAVVVVLMLSLRRRNKEGKYNKSESGNYAQHDKDSHKDPAVENLCQQVYYSEYIANLRIGRSWILPQMVDMSFTRRGKFSKDLYLENLKELIEESPSYCWKVMRNNFHVMAHIEKKDPEGYAERACWWTKELADAVKKYNPYAHNKPSVPQAFMNAFAGDGAYNAMMTMVKYLKLYYKDDNGMQMTREQCIEDIKQKAKEFNYDGLKMLDYCQKKYFDTEAGGIFDYKTYKEK